jgi:microsomal dipeptidase-like Zn-dependent dipeptidase
MRFPKTVLSIALSSLLLVSFAEKHALAETETPVWLDLHSHLWIRDGARGIVRGMFDEPTRSSSAGDRLKSKMTRSSLDPSGLRVVVVSFYAHPVLARLSGSFGQAFASSRAVVRASLLRQIAEAEKFVAENPGWVVATEPAEARAALAAGKRVLVYSVETAEGAFDTEEDRRVFVDEKKIAIVTFMHLSPDRLGRGVALMPGPAWLNAPIEWLGAWIRKTTDPITGAYVNANGLSAFGKTVLEELVKRRVWIDLSHSSDQTIREMIPVLDRGGQPALFTHTKLRDLSQTERAVPKFALARVRATHGMVGLMPTDDLLDPLPEAGSLTKTEACRRGIRAFAEEWQRAALAVGTASGVVLGSDFNAPVSGLIGGCERVTLASDPEFVERGFYRGEDLPRLFGAMQEIGVDFGKDPRIAVERFLAAWEKVRRGSVSSAPVKAGAGKAPRSP